MKKLCLTVVLALVALVPVFSMPIQPNALTDQIQKVTLENFGAVQFVPYDDSTNTRVLRLNLEKDGKVLYTFPDVTDGYGWWFDGLDEAVFADLNGDGKKDLVVIAEYMTGIGPTGAEDFKVVRVFFQKGKTFVSDEALDDELNSDTNYDKLNTSKDVIAYMASRRAGK